MIIIISGCGVKFKVSVTRPAEVNLNKFKTVAIGEIPGIQGNDVAEELTQALFQSQRYDVVDRQHLKRILEEHQLNATDYVNQSTTAKLGEILGTSALIFGRVSDAHFNQPVTQSSWTDPNTGARHTWYSRKGTAIMDVNLQVTDLTTGKILATKKIGHSVTSKTITTMDVYPAEIDPSSFIQECRRNIVAQFMKMIAPWQEQVTVRLEKFGKIPEATQGISFCKIQEWGKAVESFESALEKAKTNPKINSSSSSMAKLYYNLGVALCYVNKFKESRANLQQAYTLNSKSLYQEALNETNRREAEYKKLLEQNAT